MRTTKTTKTTCLMGGRTLAKVILLTRDESDFIEDFLAYWGAIFGHHNVIVIDNGSTAPTVMRAYEKHVENGGVVVSDTRPFGDATTFMTEHIKCLAESGTCEWIFPIETDEFVFFHPFMSRSPPPDIRDIREAIHHHLECDIPPYVGALNYGYVWGSSVDPEADSYVRGRHERPAATMTRFHDQGWDKLVVRASAFERMVQWCHVAQCKPGFVTGTTLHLGLLHFHDTGKRRAVERAIPVVEGCGYLRMKHRTTTEQVLDSRELMASVSGLSCGHKLDYVDSHLRRLQALKSSRKHLGKLVIDDDQGGNPCWDDLLYLEKRMEHSFEVDHVSRFLFNPLVKDMTR